jgi:hypothetical protein
MAGRAPLIPTGRRIISDRGDRGDASRTACVRILSLRLESITGGNIEGTRARAQRALANNEASKPLALHPICAFVEFGTANAV